MNKERRRYPRRKADWKAIIQFKDRTGFQANVIDVSEAGILLESAVKVEQGKNVTLHIVAEINAKKIKIMALAECRFLMSQNNSHQFGLRFLEISSANRITLREYVNEYSTPNKCNSNLPHPSAIRHVSRQDVR
jgi:c-di-GMP-binding flagellar brake protein YcgR